VKVKRPQLERALKAPAEARFFLFYGPDEAGSRALVRELAAAAGEGAERIDLAGSELKADPARLADEAAAISLFGGARYIVVEPAGDESLAAVEALLSAPAAGNPVALIAGALRPASKLLKTAVADPAAIAFASYVPEGRDAARLAAELAREQGLQLRPDLAGRVAESCGGNRALIEQEMSKLALYLDASPEAPRSLDEEALAAVGAGEGEGDLSRLVDSVGAGDPASLESELLRLRSEGIEGIPVIRAMLRRLYLLTRLRAEVEKGNSVGAVMASPAAKSVFFKEKVSVAEQLGRWRSDLLAKSVSRLLEAERAVKASGGLGPLAADEELFAIARQAARLR
jgi:DNA polymerase-3 subunit delta